MSQRDDLLRRVTAANPLPDERALPDEVVDSRPPLDLLINRGADVVGKAPSTAASARKRSWWAKPAIVFAAACLLIFATIGIVAVSRGGQSDSADDSAPTTIPVPTGAPGYDVRAVAVALDGSLWAVADVGIVHWDFAGGEPTLYTTKDGLPADDVGRILAGPDGTVWTGGIGWMARFDGSWTTFSAPAEPLAIGPDGAVWTAYEENDLARFDGSEWETFEAPLPLDSSQYIAPWTGMLDVAGDGTVWAATHGQKGLFAFDGADWTRYTSADGLRPSSGGTLAVAPDGTAWVGSESTDGSSGSGAARFDGSRWVVYTTADGLLDDVPNVAVGPDGTVWAIHQTGVSRFDGTRWTTFPGVLGSGMFASVDAAGTLWMPALDGGVIGFDGIDITRLEVPTTETASPTITTIAPAGTWNPILATTRAKPAPPAATCPAGTDPNAPGPVGRERPEAGWKGNLAAVFDQHAGRIVFVDTFGETWTFDVCTSTWHRMNPTGAMIGELSAGLVYDVDSDRTVALGFEQVSIYDANTNTWIQAPNDALGFGDGRFSPMGAAYDPVSGLILTTRQIWWGEPAEEAGFWELLAYDVDSNTWTLIGTISHEPTEAERSGNDGQWLELLGYSSTLDRLVFSSGTEETVLVDPRTGESVGISTDTPVVDLVWPGRVYGPANDTVYVSGHPGLMRPGDLVICGFDTNALMWMDCFDTPAELNNHRHAVYAAMVGDPINRRLILINGVGGSWWAIATDDVWAVDLDTGEWTELLEPSGQ
jgi:hypothetical protein